MLAPLALILVASSQASTGKVELVSEITDVRAGQPFTVGIRLIPAHGWHTYWMNPGDSGSPTTVTWHLPKGWTESELRYPAPSRIAAGGSFSYGYEETATLLATLTPPQTLPSGQVDLAGRVQWLTCTPEMCKPAPGDFHLKLPVTSGFPVQNSTWHVRLAEDGAKIPSRLQGAVAEARRQGDHVVLTLTGPGIVLQSHGQPYFFPSTTGMISHSKAQSFWLSENTLTMSLPVSEYSVKPPTRLTGVLKAPFRSSSAGGNTAVYIDVPIIASQEKKHA